MKPDVRVCEDLADLSQRAAAAAVRVINDAVRTGGRCSIVLSGGSTPRTFHGLLASQFRAEIPWMHVHVFWGDERYVPSEDSRSNFRMAKETLLDHVPCPAANIHRMPTHFASPDNAAEEYERTLRNQFVDEWPDFDLVLLGLGSDGHTASLFPGSPALAETTRWVVPAHAPAEPRLRLTLTLPVLTRSRTVYVLAAGGDKSVAPQQVLEGPGDVRQYPAAAVRRGPGQVVWWIDREAAGDLQ